jgi:hypothetical protein
VAERGRFDLATITTITTIVTSGPAFVIVVVFVIVWTSVFVDLD